MVSQHRHDQETVLVRRCSPLCAEGPSINISRLCKVSGHPAGAEPGCGRPCTVLCTFTVMLVTTFAMHHACTVNECSTRCGLQPLQATTVCYCPDLKTACGSAAPAPGMTAMARNDSYFSLNIDIGPNIVKPTDGGESLLLLEVPPFHAQ